MAEVKKCCCGCCSVRTGTIVLGLGSLVCSVASTCVYAWHLAYLSNKFNRNPFNWMVDHGYIFEEPDPKLMGIIEDAYVNHRKCLTIFTITGLVMSLLNVILSALMLTGAIKRGPRRLIFPWFAYKVVMLLASLVLGILVGVYMVKRMGPPVGIVLTVELIVIYAAYGYLLRTVWWYMQELRAAEQSQAGFDAVGLIKA